MSGTYIQDNSVLDLKNSEFLVKVAKDEYVININAFNLITTNPYQPRFQLDLNNLYITYLYYGNDSCRERRRQEYRKYISRCELYYIIMINFPTEERIAFKIEKIIFSEMKVEFISETDFLKLDQVDKNDYLLDNFIVLKRLKKEQLDKLKKMDVVLSEKENGMRELKDNIKIKCDEILTML